MNDDKKQKLKERMEALNKKYSQQLPEKYQEIENSWNLYLADLSESSALETFYRLIHTLKGTAATFGFVVQADICFEVQTILLIVMERQSDISTTEIDQIKKQLVELKKNIRTPAQDIS